MAIDSTKNLGIKRTMTAKLFLQKLAESLEESIDKDSNTLTITGDFVKEVAESLYQISEGMVK
ncbi:hypothetical protein KIH86_23980 [Paenibacillus sp. HN-1]|uniref:hypothetical protein n=1 Tax=Paenibacillus TaxID=44249 RepID=UPI001CAA07EE|nr:MULTISPECIES: hypothetical protein [Paenibacillus]MBY9081211.1 hypothetical protein [Paenibacillus sp. CGMCC 1.18879]MBY9087248.1 hypothetical protein [Paenibacillus sinensis]